MFVCVVLSVPAFTVATSVTVAVLDGGGERNGNEHVSVPKSQVPKFVVSCVAVSPAGSVSCSVTTPVAPGPALLTKIVNVTASPGNAVGVLTILVTPTSNADTTVT